MIEEIRSYFNATAKAENSDLRANDKPTTDEIANTIIEDTFFLEIGTMSTELLDTSIQSNIAVTLNIYKSGDNESIANYDKGYCEAIDIQARAMHKPFISQEAFIKNVVSSGIDIETINNNDNMYKFSIQFTVTVDYEYAI
jgi:hypothetical protein